MMDSGTARPTGRESGRSRAGHEWDTNARIARGVIRDGCGDGEADQTREWAEPGCPRMGHEGTNSAGWAFVYS